MRRTKATQIYRKTGNLRAVQLLLGHTKLESTVRYLGIEVDDALQIAEQIELYVSDDSTTPRSFICHKRPQKRAVFILKENCVCVRNGRATRVHG